MNVSKYCYFLDEIMGDLAEGIICHTDTVKVIRSVPGNRYLPIKEYYYEDDECDKPYEEILVMHLIEEIRIYMNHV